MLSLIVTPWEFFMITNTIQIPQKKQLLMPLKQVYAFLYFHLFVRYKIPLLWLDSR